MNILKTGSEIQILKFIPRLYIETINIDIKNMETNEVVVMSGTTNIISGYLVYQSVFDLTEGTFYTFDVKSTEDTLIYRGQIFCTDQTDLQNYNMTQGDFIEPDNVDDKIITF